MWFRGDISYSEFARDMLSGIMDVEYLGIVAHDQGEYDQARHHLTEALAKAREMGDPMVISHVLGYLSLTTLALGETVETENLLRESLALAREIGYRSGIGRALDGLGIVVQVTRPNEARALFASSCDVFRGTGDLRNLSRVLSHQGYNSLAISDVPAAQNSFIAVLHLAREGGFIPFALDALVGLASLQAKQGDREHALELLLVVLNHPSSLQDTKNRAAQLRAELEALLTPSQIESIQANAEEETLESVVEKLLK